MALWLGFAVRAMGADNKPVAAAAPTVNTDASAPEAAEIRALIGAGTLSELRWPNFSDYRIQIEKFYVAGGYSLAWVRDGRVTVQARALIRLFAEASLKGLNLEDYDGGRWQSRLAALERSTAGDRKTALVHFDLALTVCAMRYISNLHVGRVNPKHFKFGLDVGSKKYDLADVLRRQVLQAHDVGAVIATVEPPYAGYQRAEKALADYIALAAQGDGPPLPVPPKTVRPGDTYSGMKQLVARLRRLGDLALGTEFSADDNVYQGAMVAAVEHFQRRHGLMPDGAVGKATFAELNTPLSVRVDQLKLTLERYRWIPPGFPQPPIVVNIPEFRLRTMRRQPASFLSMKVVVGRAYRTQTPVFANEMRYVIFRPYWNVPRSILRSELVAKIARDPDYVAENNYEVMNGSDSVVTDGEVSDAVLSGLRSGELWIRQKPGPRNALGLVKFVFPNRYNVYFHSTPFPELFEKARRDFSHGCIRVENPVGLAAWVLRDKPEWTVERIRATMNGNETLQVNLDKPIPVLILYSTAVVEPDGEVKFFKDIYGHDASLEKVLAAGYPYPID
jgi:L,D-transpeptidase YcbB